MMVGKETLMQKVRGIMRWANFQPFNDNLMELNGSPKALRKDNDFVSFVEEL